MSLVERGGRVRSFHIPNVTADASVRSWAGTRILIAGS